MIPYIHLPLACEHVTSPISASEPGELWWPERSAWKFHTDLVNRCDYM
jgi:hypothetical protein